MRLRTPGIRTALALLALTVALAGCDWAQVHFGAEATNFNPYEPSLTAASTADLSVQWSVPCACITNGALIADDTVYAIDGTGGPAPYNLALRAFAAGDGRARWSTPLGQNAGLGVLAAVANGLVYVVVRNPPASDQLVAIDATSGTVRWRRTPPAPGSGPVGIDSPVVSGARLLVTATASDATTLSAYDPTGRRVWTVVPGGQVLDGATVAAVAGDTVYVSTFLPLADGRGFILLRGYAVADGAARSTVSIAGDLPVQSLATANGLVYGTFYTGGGRLGSVGTFAADPASGTILWTGETNTLAVTPAAVLSNDARREHLVAHDPRTGAPIWSAPQSDGRAAATNELVFFNEGNIRRLSDGTLVGQLPTVDGAGLRIPTPSGGRVFAWSNSRLYALAP